MKQSRDGSPLEICVTHTIYVISTIRTTEEDMMPSCIATASSSRNGRHLASPSSVGMNQYTLARLSKTGDGNILDILDTRIGALNELLNVEELNDGSWEMVVLKSYCPTLQAMLDEIFPGSDVDLYHDPIESTISEVKHLGYNAAKTLCEYLFIKRAERMVKEGWPMAADFYEHLTARMNGRCYQAAISDVLASFRPLYTVFLMCLVIRMWPKPWSFEYRDTHIPCGPNPNGM